VKADWKWTQIIKCSGGTSRRGNQLQLAARQFQAFDFPGKSVARMISLRI